MLLSNAWAYREKESTCQDPPFGELFSHSYFFHFATFELVVFCNLHDQPKSNYKMLREVYVINIRA